MPKSAGRAATAAVATVVASSVFYTTPVSIISIGYDHKGWHNVKKAFQDAAGWSVFYVSDTLKRDPYAMGVGHEEDGRYSTTQQAVFGQHGFDSIIVDQLYSALLQAGVAFGIVLACKRGMHRSNTSGWELEQDLSMLTFRDNTPMFNAKHFPISEYYGENGTKQLIRDAQTWLHLPPVPNPLGYIVRFDDRYAYKAVSRQTAAVENMRKIDLVMHSDEFFQAQRDTEARFEAMHGDEPPSSVFVDEEREAQVIEEEIDVPEWADSFEFNPKKWWHVLDRHSVDETARESLFLLAQSSDKGQHEAWLLVKKLLFNHGPTPTIRNPSKFIHKCSLSSLELIEKEFPALGASSASSGGERKRPWERDGGDRWGWKSSRSENR